MRFVKSIVGPIREKTAKAAMRLTDFENESRVPAHALNLLSVSDDLLVLRQTLQFFVGKKRAGTDIEAGKSGFETGPLVFNDLPDKAGPEDTAGHLRQVSIVRHAPQSFSTVNLRQYRLKRGDAPAVVETCLALLFLKRATAPLTGR